MQRMYMMGIQTAVAAAAAAVAAVLYLICVSLPQVGDLLSAVVRTMKTRMTILKLQMW
jgi:cobalamin biosynthesis protein CbiD